MESVNCDFLSTQFLPVDETIHKEKAESPVLSVKQRGFTVTNRSHTVFVAHTRYFSLLGL